MLMQSEQQGNWVYHNNNEQESSAQLLDEPEFLQPPQQPVTWTASEFIAHHKDASWYAMLFGGFIVLAGLVYFSTKDELSIIFIAVALILFVIIGARKPQQRTYSVDNRGVTIDHKFYSYDSFKSFAILNEGAIGSVVFMPLQRFTPELTIYFAPDDGERILDVLAASLPNDQRREKAVDRLMKRMRF